MASSDSIICTLTEKSREIAKKELNEDPDQRDGQLETFRQWIAAEPQIKCGGDRHFLLRFLRVAKFSQLKARQKLESFLSYLEVKSDWLRDTDLADPKFAALYDTSYVIPMTNLDKQGRRIIICRPGQIDASGRFSIDETIRGLLMAYWWSSFDENVQVNGYLFFFDFTGFTLKHLTFLGLDAMKGLTKLVLSAFPGRFKAFHYYNTGPVFETLMAAILPLFSKKHRDRFYFHGSNLENVFKVLQMEMLPDEYMPDDYNGPSQGSVKDVIDAFKQEILKPENVERIKFETGPEFAIDKSKKIQSENASFRKLNVD